MEMINPAYKKISLRKQCNILSVHRSSQYYVPIAEKPENVKMMNVMDEHSLKHPTEGVVSMVDLLKEKGYPVETKRIRLLFKLMGYQSLYRRRNLTKNALTKSDQYIHGWKRSLYLQHVDRTVLEKFEVLLHLPEPGG